MTKGRAEAEQVETSHETQRGSHRRLKASAPRSEVLLAFADALRDILHDELRATG